MRTPQPPVNCPTRPQPAAPTCWSSAVSAGRRVSRQRGSTGAGDCAGGATGTGLLGPFQLTGAAWSSQAGPRASRLTCTDAVAKGGPPDSLTSSISTRPGPKPLVEKGIDPEKVPGCPRPGAVTVTGPWPTTRPEPS